jgi:hypothetical protein
MVASQEALGIISLTGSVVLIIAPSPIVVINGRPALQLRPLVMILIVITLKFSVIAMKMVGFLIIHGCPLSIILVSLMTHLTRWSLAIIIPHPTPILIFILIPESLSQVFQLLRNSEHPLFTLLRWRSNELIGIF